MIKAKAISCITCNFYDYRNNCSKFKIILEAHEKCLIIKKDRVVINFKYKAWKPKEPFITEKEMAL